jgi:peptidoglycan/xylan/chitin deacetylase (PgdA/CDA1 family)
VSAVVCLTYDDGLPVHREHVAPLLASRGLAATFYLPVARDEVIERVEEWRAVSAAGHELGNHSCWHPCRGRPDWLPVAYHLENYDRTRFRDELSLANRILRMIDGQTVRSYGATCGNTSVGTSPEECVLDDLRDLFPIVRAGLHGQPGTGRLPFTVPYLHIDGKRAEEVAEVIATMRTMPDSWLVIGLHGVGQGTHNSFMDRAEHDRLVEWIAGQGDWLTGLTLRDAVKQLGGAAKQLG